jgi:septal ring factor EnvC (AmiA/AmiB activator)
MCYCDGNTDGMGKSAEEAGQKITELKSKLEAEKAEKSQLDQALIQHKKDREAATADLSAAEKIRESEHAEFVETTGGAKDNLDAMTAAVAALEKGMGKAFLQSKTNSALLQKVVQSAGTVDDYERGEVMDFLQGKQNPFGDYSAQSGEIVGILKAMRDEMDKDLNGAIGDEDKAAAGFAELAGAKKDEIAAASEAIEAKTQRSGELAVSITNTADDIEDTTKELADTQAFLANLSSMCATKKKEWDERCKVRAEEVSAISEAIKILNDDDALDLFKKTLALPQSGVTRKFGFLQQKSGMGAVARARRMFASIVDTVGHKPQIQLIEMSLKAKQVDFSKVLAMIDGMEQVLHEDQKNDDTQKAFCDKDIAKSVNEKKDTEEAIAAGEAFIEETTSESEAIVEEIKVLQKEIKDLDKAVAEATEQRKEEHADFLVFQQQSNAALQLIEKAKNRLNKFYRPSVYKEPPKKQLSEEEQITANSGFAFVQIGAYEAPPPPPETWGAYQKKDGKSNGVMALMDMLVKELSGDLTESKHTEETSQKDYERLMSDSTASRAQNVQSITDKEDAKADMDTKIEEAKSKKASDDITLQDVKQYLVQLHAECDFLVENYDVRKAARETELASLANGKSVLSGANFS